MISKFLLAATLGVALVPYVGTAASGTGAGVVVNSDRAGSWSCSGTALSAYRIVGGTEVALSPGWVTDCDRRPNQFDVTWTTPPPLVVGDYTITVGAARYAVDRAEQPPPGDTRPFVGDGATVTAAASSVSIVGPGVDVRIRGLWASADAYCEQLDAPPSRSTDSGVLGLTVNGEHHDQVSEPRTFSLASGLVQLVLNRSLDDASHSGRVAMTLVVPDETQPVVAWARAGHVGNPCTT